MNCLERIENYFIKSDYPNVGYRHNLLEGAGQYLCLPAGYSLSILKNGDSLCNKIYAIAIFILTSPLTLVGSIFREVGRILPHSPTGHTETALGVTDPNRIEQMYDLLELFHEACEQVGFKYTLMAGIVLGEQRHGGIIPWDDDIDVGFMAKDLDVLRNQLAPILKEKGIELNYLSAVHLYVFTFTKEHRKEHYPLNDEVGVLELCPLVRAPNAKGEERVIFESSFQRVQSPNDSFPPEDILDEAGDLKTELRSFGPNERLQLHFPRQEIVHNYLFGYYGSKCLEEAVSSHRHVHIPCTNFNLYLPVFLKEKVPVVEKNCAQGCEKWKGFSKTAVQAKEEKIGAVD
jgi:hypothetical protein